MFSWKKFLASPTRRSISSSYLSRFFGSGVEYSCAMSLLESLICFSSTEPPTVYTSPTPNPRSPLSPLPNLQTLPSDVPVLPHFIIGVGLNLSLTVPHLFHHDLDLILSSLAIIPPLLPLLTPLPSSGFPTLRLRHPPAPPRLSFPPTAHRP